MTERPKLALIDVDYLVYRVGFSCKDETEQIAKARLTEMLTDVVYMELKCVDYESFFSFK